MSTNVVRRRLISLIGAGNIGGVMGYFSQLLELGDVVLFDVVPNLGAAKALDIMHANSVFNRSFRCKGTSNYEDIKDSDVCIITAGLTKLPGKSNDEWNRDDLVAPNSAIMKTIGENIKKYAPNALVICITNPMDVMTKLLLKSTGFATNKVVGMGGLLDSSRMCYYIAEKLGVHPKCVHGSVIGAHGNTMIPLVSKATVNGIPLMEFVESGFLSEADIKAIEKRTIDSGIELLKLYVNGSAYYAPATAAVEMASAYLNDKKSVIVCSCYIDGKYGHKDIYFGTPAIIGAGGVEKVIEVKISDADKVRLEQSVKEIRRLEALTN